MIKGIRLSNGNIQSHRLPRIDSLELPDAKTDCASDSGHPARTESPEIHLPTSPFALILIQSSSTSVDSKRKNKTRQTTAVVISDLTHAEWGRPQQGNARSSSQLQHSINIDQRGERFHRQGELKRQDRANKERWTAIRMMNT